jgi:hypothetical protein
MATRIIPDEDKPSVAIEISLEKPLPDYDLNEIEQPTPRDVDGVLVSQGFRDLVDDARGVLLPIPTLVRKSPISISLRPKLIPWKSLKSRAQSVPDQTKSTAPASGLCFTIIKFPPINRFLFLRSNARGITPRNSSSAWISSELTS